MTPQPFKLLHLPIVTLRKMLQFLNPIELFELSQCSRRALSIIPLSGSRNFKLQMDEFSSIIRVNDHIFRIRITREHSKDEYALSGTRIFMESKVKICHQSEQESKLSKQELISFWRNRHIGFKTVFFHISGVFKCPIECAKFDPTIPTSHYMPIIDFISSRQSEIKELFVGGKDLSDKKVTKIFNKLRVTEHLVMFHQFSRPPIIQFNYSKSIYIWNSSWITTEHLNSMKHCIVIELDQSTLTDYNMTLFLNDWKSGKFPNLQYLSIKSNFLSKNFTAFGLPSLQNPVDPEDHKRYILGFRRSIYGGVDVRREFVSYDGVLGELATWRAPVGANRNQDTTNLAN